MIAPASHGILQEDLSANALAAVRTLNEANFSAELVGGCVRDLLLGKDPKDFDVVTNATPTQIKGLFQRCHIIGRRFRLAQVQFGREIIQIATYRSRRPGDYGSNPSNDISSQGKLLKDNDFGHSLEQDAFRRDLTLNALYLRPSDMNVIDYTGGYRDIEEGVVRTIGDAKSRYREDPVRMLRTIRFAASLDFEIDEASATPIDELAELLRSESNSRMIDEIVKLFFQNHAEATFELLLDYGLFQELFPAYSNRKGIGIDETSLKWLYQLFRETDSRKPNGETLSMVYFLAAIMWLPYRNACQVRKARLSRTRRLNFSKVAENVLKMQSSSTKINAVQSQRIENIWRLQGELENPSAAVREIARSANFRAALRLLELRSRCGEINPRVTKKWVAVRDQQMRSPRRQARRHRRRKPQWA